MNQVLQLKGRFDQRNNPSKPGPVSLPKGKTVTSEHLMDLKNQLEAIAGFWKKNTFLNGALVTVHYTGVVAKSNRIRVLLGYGSTEPKESIRGARFDWDSDDIESGTPRHVFTHYVPVKYIEKSSEYLETAAKVISEYYHGEITSDDIDIINQRGFRYKNIISKTKFVNIVFDGYHVERFSIDKFTEDLDKESIITIFRTDVETKKLLSGLGINVFEDQIIDGTTLRLSPDDLSKLKEKAPYLISMGLTDFTQISSETFEGEDDYDTGLIPKPSNEPIVGVIDTHFNSEVYFKDWVDYRNMMSPDIEVHEEDKKHGTAVSYIIVDGPKGNPELEDGCGRFRVRLFGVATHNGFSSFTVLRQIRNIVADNPDIKVWNLSLGSKMEISRNYISPEAAELDRIQNDYDVIFVVAGTNRPEDVDKTDMKIGAPADSLNSLVVNSVNNYGKPASYTRVGPVLSFFNKPDFSYYGGDGVHDYEQMTLCVDSMGAHHNKGTSFAAPWVTRKVAYMIYVLGISREITKALLIDAAAGWNRKDDVSHSIGYGILPKKIEEIVESPEDEIRFVLSGTSEEFETYTYNLPVPVIKGQHPFWARATLAYFPRCDRNQGVDYTSTEMDIHFGRARINKKGKTEIVSIDKNRQNEEGINILYEPEARKLYRKWDNVKHISEETKVASKPRKAYEAGMWGLSIKTKERLTSRRTGPLPFGVVITFKEMNGKNRIDEFIKLCAVRGWLVNPIDVKTRVDVYNKAEEEVEFE